jgi:colanic acid biosynthesis glycosyl transferase WcaI
VFAGRSPMGRVASDLAFLLNGASALVRGRVRRSDLVISVSPSVLTVFLGWAATSFRGRHVVVVHDIESGLAGGLGMVRSGFVVQAFRAIERLALNRADVILVLSQHMKACLIEIGVKTPIHVVPLWVDTDRIYPLPARQTAGPRTILYSGNIGRKQGLNQILDVAEELSSFGDEMRFVIRGNGSERDGLLSEIRNRRLDNVALEPLLPAAQLNEGLADGHIHLVPQNPDAADFAVPSKAYAIMAAGRPFVATARPNSPLWDMATDSGAFVCVPPYSVDEFADALLRLARDPALCGTLGALGREYILSKFSKQAVTRQLLTHIEGVA